MTEMKGDIKGLSVAQADMRVDIATMKTKMENPSPNYSPINHKACLFCSPMHRAIMKRPHRPV